MNKRCSRTAIGGVSLDKAFDLIEGTRPVMLVLFVDAFVAQRRRLWVNLSNMNEYVVPFVIVLAAIALLAWRWRTLPATERRWVAIACATMLAFTLWVPLAAPVACLVKADLDWIVS